MVLPIDRGKLRLQEDPLTGNPTRRQPQQCLADPRFVVMNQLVGGVDRRKPGFDGLQDETRRGLLFQAVPYMNEGIVTPFAVVKAITLLHRFRYHTQIPIALST